MEKTIKLKHLFQIFLSIFSIFTCLGQASISASGNQPFCPGNPIKIVTDFTITDPTKNTIQAFYIQISEGYQLGFDELILSGNHPTINPLWNSNEGKLTLLSINNGSEMLLTDLENAVKDIVFTTTASNITAEKKFSLTIGDANYLPETDHFYKFIPNLRITWSQAKIDAENSNYYGRKGYLATLTSQIEADFAGKQASGAGWIGGSDQETEGVWKWVTGPETGTIFWNGLVNGSTPNFAFWNIGEPNNDLGNEDYAHITDPSIGNRGTWNDLPNIGGNNVYEPKGYIIEYGGMPGDVPTNIQAFTRIFTPQILSIVNATICESGSAQISATKTAGDILWFDAPSGGNQLGSGNDFTTPFITTTTTYYALASINACTNLPRTAVTVTVTPRPAITSTTDDIICSGKATLAATASEGNVFWYDSLTSVTPIFVGNTFTTPNLTTSVTFYVTANRNNCETATRRPVSAILDDTTPNFEVSENTYVLCEDVGTITLETKNPQGIYTYVWRNDTNIFSEKSASIAVSSDGNYYVKAISEAGCISDEKQIVVKKSEIASISKDDVIITDNSTNNSIQVANPNLGIGDYEYAIDNEFGNYTDVGFFQNLVPGMHTLFVKDKLGCGVTPFRFSILAFPSFFTPNGDGENDSWTIKGFDPTFYTNSKITIFDRFGKLIHQIDDTTLGWNGDYQGKKLPSNNFWFRVLLIDINGNTIQKFGNFSLIR